MSAPSKICWKCRGPKPESAKVCQPCGTAYREAMVKKNRASKTCWKCKGPKLAGVPLCRSCTVQYAVEMTRKESDRMEAAARSQVAGWLAEAREEAARRRAQS